MNRLALNAASSLLRSLRPPSPLGIFFPPLPCPHLLFFLSFPVPSAGLITGLSGREERRDLSPCLGMSHPLGFVYSLEKCPPPPPPQSLGGSWRVA